MWLTSNGWVDLSLLRNDPLLMNYLKANLPEQAKHVMDTHFDYIYTKSRDGNEIIIEGRARGSIEPTNNLSST